MPGKRSGTMMRRKAKRAALAALLAAAALLLGGCAGQIEERPMADLSAVEIPAGAEAPLADGADDVELEVKLYFLGADGTTLVPVSRRITARGGESRVQAALSALLAGPMEGETGVFWPEMGTARSARQLEVSSGVATVDLPADAQMLAQEVLYAVRLAIANTLTEFAEVSYVNVLIGGSEEGFDLGGTLPVGTVTRTEDMDTGTRYHRMDEQRLSGDGVTLMTTLYFPAADGGFVLPEVRNVRYQHAAPIEYLYTLLEEIGKGTNNPLASRDVPAPLDYIREMPEIVRTEDGAYRAIEIRFTDALNDALAWAGLTRGVYMAMLTDTLMGFVPGVEGLKVSIGDEEITGLGAAHAPDGQEMEFVQPLATRGDFGGYIGAPAALYAREENGDGLIRISCTLRQALADDPRERLTGLMRLGEDETAYALPSGIDESDILAVHVGETVIAVNLSAKFRRQLEMLEPNAERAAVYAMVNTLTEGMGSRRVAFFFEGKQVERLAGALEMRGTFMRNPGMVVN